MFIFLLPVLTLCYTLTKAQFFPYAPPNWFPPPPWASPPGTIPPPQSSPSTAPSQNCPHQCICFPPIPPPPPFFYFGQPQFTPSPPAPEPEPQPSEPVPEPKPQSTEPEPEPEPTPPTENGPTLTQPDDVGENTDETPLEEEDNTEKDQFSDGDDGSEEMGVGTTELIEKETVSVETERPTTTSSRNNAHKGGTDNNNSDGKNK